MGETRCPRLGAGALKLPIVIAVTIILSVLIYRHTPGVDGPWYAHYGWHRAPAARIYPLMALCALPLAAGLVLFDRRQQRPAIPLMLAMMSVMGFILVSVAHLGNQPSWRPMIEMLESPMALSYLADAARLASGPGTLLDWLAHWHELIGQMFLHSRTKPPGPVLYFATFVHLFGITHQAAVNAGLTLAAIISLTVPATYSLARLLGANKPAAFYAAACLALFPSIDLFFPSLDAAYVIGSCALMGFWTRAMRHRSLIHSIAFGATLALVTFFIYNILVIGVLLAALGWIVTPPRRRVPIILRQAAIAMATCVTIYFVLWLVTGFDPIATFWAAYRNQSHLLPGFGRPYPATIWFDLIDFALGVGWLPVLLVFYYLSDRGGQPPGPPVAIIIAGLLQLLVVAVTGLLPGETARVWAFLTPVIALPAGAELARWTRSARIIAYLCMLLILTMLSQNLHATHGTLAPLVGKTRPATR